MDKAMIETGEPCLDWRESYALGKLKNKIGDIVPRQFTYGYAITCHKSQGSEWDKVLVIEEKFPFDKTEHARWLYTAATRSAEKLVLVR
jgi:DNA helicase IV